MEYVDFRSDPDPDTYFQKQIWIWIHIKMKCIPNTVLNTLLSIIFGRKKSRKNSKEKDFFLVGSEAGSVYLQSRSMDWDSDPNGTNPQHC